MIYCYLNKKDFLFLIFNMQSLKFVKQYKILFLLTNNYKKKKKYGKTLLFKIKITLCKFLILNRIVWFCFVKF